ncbi:sugar kinase [Escherichia coli]|nr:sugar kinase [Escherichia coli]
MSKVFTIGEILVEIMASKIGQPFDQPGIWNGPYPSGAPAIFIDQVTRLGVPCGIISCVGNDGFGDINIHRLAADGVDIRGISVLPLEATGSAFVTYHNSGDRDFIFNIKNAACGKLSAQHVDENILKDCTHFHIMGSSLFSFHMVDAVKKAVTIVKANGGVISFDPNIRKEMLDIPEMRDALHFVLELTDIYMPSEGEVLLLSPHSTPERAIAGFLEEGVKEVIVKRGNQGASYYSANEQFHVESYPVEEVDPTGAGDCFGGAWIACRQLGFDAHRSLQYANACGALAVTRRGPMEETSRLAEIEAFIQRHDMSIREAAQ